VSTSRRTTDVTRFRRHRLAAAAVRFQVLGLRGQLLTTALELVADRLDRPP